MTLLEECILALGDDTKVLDMQETQNTFKAMINTFPMTKWGRIDWGKTDGEFEVVPKEDILERLCRVYNDIDTTVYILWDEASLPAVKTDLKKAIGVIDDVTAVSFDTWFFCPSANYVIELYHEHEIRVGWKINDK